MPVLVVVTQTSMLLLNTSMGLPSRKIRLISLRELLGHSADVGDQTIEQVERHAFSHDDTEDFDLLFVGREGVVWRLKSA